MANISINDIARRAGVSQPTVSAVLSGGGGNTRVSPATASRIKALATAMGYRPNAAARAIATGKFQAITILLSKTGPSRSSLSQSFLRSLGEALEHHKLNLSLAMIDEDRLREPDYVPRMLQEHSSDGFLINYNVAVPESLSRLILGTKLPFVWLNDKRPTDAVYPDDRAAGEKAARLLIEAGHRHVSYVDHMMKTDSPDLHYSRRDRRDGFTRACRKAGIAPMEWGRHNIPEEFNPLLEHWLGILRQPDRPTGLVAYSTGKLHPVMSALDILGLRVPEDFSVIVFGDEPEIFRYPLTTLVVPSKEIASIAVNILAERIAAKSASLPSIAIPFGLSGEDLVRPPRVL